jgi:hypothetical protein
LTDNSFTRARRTFGHLSAYRWASTPTFEMRPDMSRTFRPIHAKPRKRFNVPGGVDATFVRYATSPP